MVEQQRQAYKVAGVDEDEPAMDPKKRKANDADAEDVRINYCYSWRHD